MTLPPEPQSNTNPPAPQPAVRAAAQGTPTNNLESNPPPTRPSNERLERVLWQGKIGPAFWTIASIFSVVLNVILVIVLLVLGRELFSIKALVQDQLIGGLYDNFVKMDDASIQTTITVKDTIIVDDFIPVVFDLPLNQETSVILTTDTPVKNASVFLNGVPVPTDIILKKGTKLNIALNLVVPVNQTIPVHLNVPVNLQVPVNIPLNQTELHEPFVGLQSVVLPYKDLLGGLPNSWDETPACGPLTGWLCELFLGAQ